MNKKYFLLVLLLLFSFNYVYAYNSNDLKAYYNFDETNITHFHDSVANQNLNTTGSIYLSSDIGIKGNALEYPSYINASDIYYEANLNYYINNYDSFTINFWILNVSSITNTQNYVQLTNSSTSTTLYHGLRVESDVTSGYFLNNITGGVKKIVHTDFPTSNLSWHMITFTYHDNNVYAWLDGQLKQAGTIPQGLPANANILRIGGFNYQLMDELSIWKTNLLSSDLLLLFNSFNAQDYNDTLLNADSGTNTINGFQHFIIDANHTNNMSENTILLGYGLVDSYNSPLITNYTLKNDSYINTYVFGFDFADYYNYNFDCDFSPKVFDIDKNILLSDNNVYNITDRVLTFENTNNSNATSSLAIFFKKGNKYENILFIYYNFTTQTFTHLNNPYTNGVLNASLRSPLSSNILTGGKLGLRINFHSTYYTYSLFYPYDTTFNNIFFVSDNIYYEDIPDNIEYSTSGLIYSKNSYYKKAYPYLNYTIYIANSSEQITTSCNYTYNDSLSDNSHNFCMFYSEINQDKNILCNKIILTGTVPNTVAFSIKELTGYDIDFLLSKLRLPIIIFTIILFVTLSLGLNNGIKESYGEVNNQNLYFIIFGLVVAFVVLWLLGFLTTTIKILLVIIITLVIFYFISKIFIKDK